MTCFYEHKKRLRPGFSFRRFSQLLGLGSPNYLPLILQGHRKLTDKLAPRVAKVLGLEPSESAYFLALVRMENAASVEETEAAKRDLLAALKKLVTREIAKSQNRILDRWYYLAVRELVFLKDFAPTAQWISEKLRGLITPEQAEEALDVLITEGLIQKNPDGTWEARDIALDAGDETREKRLLQGHMDVLSIWIRLLPKLSKNERELGFLNIPISSGRIPELRERILRFQDEIIGWVQDEKQADTLVQLGTYLIPLTHADNLKIVARVPSSTESFA